MRAPAFFEKPVPTLTARLLQPLGALYGTVTARRMAQPGIRAERPVVCIGNLTAGGAGKTPTAIAVAAMLRDEGEKPVFLTRGYGGSLAGPVVVDPARHRAGEVGDEPLLLARTAPVVVARDRPAGAALAIEAGASVVVMDDGLQNPTLAKDFTLAVVDGGAGFGNALCLPAGPLRAPLAAQWPHLDAVLVIGAGPGGERAAKAAEAAGKVCLSGRLAPDPAAAAALAGRGVLAFAGIGRPQKFFETLSEVGAEVAATRAFPDHHPYSARDILALRREADRLGLVLATTEKDAIRLHGLLAAADSPIAVLPVRLVLRDEGRLALLLRERLAKR